MNLPLPYQSLDSNGYIRDVNQKWLDTLKYVRKEAINHHFTEFISPEHKKKTQKCFRQFKQNNFVENVETELIRKDGKRIIALFCGKIERDKKGRFLKSHCIFHDITERKGIELLLLKSEEQFRSVIENMKDIFYRTDKNGNIIMASPSAPKILGYASVDEIIGRSVRSFWANPQNRRDMMTEIQRAGYVTDYEVTILKKDGSPLPVSVSSSLLRDAHGNILGVEGIIRDITDRKRDEEALRQSELHFRNLFETTNDSILIVDQQTRNVVNANSSACKLYGYSLKEFLRLNIRDLSAEPAKTFTAVSNGIKKVPLRFHRRKDGSVFPVEITGNYFTICGKTLHTAFVRDITEQKRLEDECGTALEFLQLINAAPELSDLINISATFFQQKSGSEALGIRLKEGDDYPYYESRGFSAEFVKIESSLCARDVAGDVIRDDVGNPMLSCMCGNIICGRFDTSKPFFTKNGSFWTNSTTQLLACTTEADRQARTRNRCNGEGYESVALIPLIYGNERLGLIQLNDRRQGMFTPAIVALWERLAGYLSVALTKSKTEEALRTSEERLRSSEEKFSKAFQASPEAISITSAADGKYLDVNDVFLRKTGYQWYEVAGKTANDLSLWVDSRDRDLYIAKLDGNGSVRDFETHFRMRSGEIRYFLISSETMQIGGEKCYLHYNQDITDRIFANQNIQEYQKQLKSLSLKLVLKEDKERRRIASDLHDRISQSLFIAKLRLGECRTDHAERNSAESLDAISLLHRKRYSRHTFAYI